MKIYMVSLLHRATIISSSYMTRVAVGLLTILTPTAARFWSLAYGDYI